MLIDNSLQCANHLFQHRIRCARWVHVCANRRLPRYAAYRCLFPQLLTLEPKGSPICSGSTAAAAGAAFGAVSTVGSTLFGCCIIGHPRRQAIYNDGSAWNVSTSGHLEAGWCGNRVNVYKSTHEVLTGPGVSGSYNSQTTGWVQNSAHGFGWQWDTGHTRAHAGWFTMTTNDHTSTTGWGNSTEIRF
ncbi:hypothetical protein BJX68DRAFT_226549 [Aspergillus pseudodeflectus]|uniref:Uncharacterized protein n=1 Tax=Aspergillus pseudodeflectus TaxID=176178 RepID=A0ABR4L535_9EURO